MAIFNGWRITRAGVVFVIGVVVLAAAVFGGVWYVKERGEQARRDEAIKIAEQQLEEQSEVAQQPVNGTVEAENEQTNTSQSASAPAELPATGVETQLIAVVMLAFAASYYAASRRAVRSL